MSEQTLGISIDTRMGQMVAETKPAMAYARRGRLGFGAWQKRLRKRFLELLAIDGKPKTPPKVRFVEETPHEGYVRRRGYMLAADGLAVPFFLLRPDPRPSGTLGVCLAIHGHGPGKTIPVGIASNDHERELIEGGQRDYAVQAVRNGYLAIVPDLRGFGELVLSEDAQAGRGGCTQLACRLAHLGKPLMGQRVSDVMQFVDWVRARRNVDKRRVVITGNSGGGMISLFAAAADRRITSAAPSCYFSTFAGSILAMWHCPCNFVPGLQQVAEMSDLAGLVAPRPMLIVAGVLDAIFPIDEVRKSYTLARRVYRDSGAPGNVKLYEGAGGHRFYATRVWDFFREKHPLSK